MTVRQFIDEANAFEYSNEYFSLMQEAMEYDLRVMALESLEFQESMREEERFDSFEEGFFPKFNNEDLELFIEEGSQEQEPGFFKKLLNTIKGAINKFINFILNFFKGSKKKREIPEVVQETIKEHEWSQTEIAKVFHACGFEEDEMDAFDTPNDHISVSIASDVKPKTQKRFKTLIALGENPSHVTFYPYKSKYAKSQQGSICAAQPEDIIRVCSEFFTVDIFSSPGLQKLNYFSERIELWLSGRDVKRNGLDIEYDDKKIDKAIKDIQECRSLLTDKMAAVNSKVLNEPKEKKKAKYKKVAMKATKTMADAQKVIASTTSTLAYYKGVYDKVGQVVCKLNKISGSSDSSSSENS